MAKCSQCGKDLLDVSYCGSCFDEESAQALAADERREAKAQGEVFLQ